MCKTDFIALDDLEILIAVTSWYIRIIQTKNWICIYAITYKIKEFDKDDFKD